MAIVVGDFTLNGFVAGLFSPTFTFGDAGAPTDDYVFNWAGPDADGNNAGGQIVTVDTTGDSWSLTVSLSSLAGAFGGEQLWSGNVLLAGGEIDGAGFI